MVKMIMAEPVTDEHNYAKTKKQHWVDTIPECSICLESCFQPVQLPCTHIFCFLCVKGFVQTNQLCALCRKDINPDYLLDPVLVEVKEEPKKKKRGGRNKVLWFYEGRNGWWQYDVRTMSTLEEAFKKKEQACETLIAGHFYVVDFERMVQYRKNNSRCTRRVKRDKLGGNVKGVAGLKSAQTK